MKRINRRSRAPRHLALLALACTALMTAPARTPAEDQAAPLAIDDIPKEKQTTLGLYMTATEAYDAWRTDPEGVKILDVRTPEEFLFVGHAMMAVNIPLVVTSYEWDPSGTQLVTKSNPNFVSEVKEWAKPGDRILVMCRSGGRSAKAINKLAEAGFTNAYNVVDGMEGDLITDQTNANYGKRKLNGWMNASLPWSYAVDRDHMRLPAAR